MVERREEQPRIVLIALARPAAAVEACSVCIAAFTTHYTAVFLAAT
ncbi:hypothetical protein [Kitasatospora herbaricolor]|uniref:Uncharacterized protein n=1 Tax=Kitasatospora herbaricolor TaxID=68217 RepID=A0ABZ1WGQ2_9ACTN|nr:hypothetical protein [Kitasatospora herbaricolor]